MLSLFNATGTLVFNALDTDSRWATPRVGTHTSCAWIPGNLLNEGEHIVSIFLNTIAPGTLDRHASVADAVSFLVADSGGGRSAKGSLTQTWGGAISPLLGWTHVVGAQPESKVGLHR
jgi:hypothetical protein